MPLRAALAYTTFGVAVAGVWRATVWLFAIPVGNTWAAIALSSLGEDMARVAGLTVLARRPGSTAQSAAWLGLGFGLVEAIPRWIALATGAVRTVGILGYVSASVAVLFHVVLCLVLWIWLQRKKPVLGFSVCLITHLSYNAYVLLFTTTYNIPSLTLDVMLRIVVLAGVIGWLLSRRFGGRAASASGRTSRP